MKLGKFVGAASLLLAVPLAVQSTPAEAAEVSTVKVCSSKNSVTTMYVFNVRDNHSMGGHIEPGQCTPYVVPVEDVRVDIWPAGEHRVGYGGPYSEWRAWTVVNPSNNQSQVWVQSRW
jgi:hypothetical protein